jgi:cyclopropane fatty-acyl-phospholipid synthase-like methyltransferase
MTDHFADKAADWDERPVPLQISEGVARALDARVTLAPEMRVLDFGAGTGLLCGHVAPRVGRVTAVDISPAMLARLADKAELRDKVEVVCQDLLEAPLGQRFDLVVSAMAMHHVEDTGALLRTLHAHLDAGGRLAVADLDREDGTFHPAGTEGVHHEGFDRAELGALAAAAGFVDVHFETACEVDRDERRYPVFLLTATRP